MKNLFAASIIALIALPAFAGSEALPQMDITVITQSADDASGPSLMVLMMFLILIMGAGGGGQILD